MSPLEWVVWPIVGAGVIVAAVLDLTRRRVPSWLPWSMVVGCLIARVAFEGLGTLSTGLLGGVAGAAGCAVPFALVALSGPRVGWGEVALLAAAGAGLGFPRALAAVFLVSICGALGGIGFVLWRRRRSASVLRSGTAGTRAMPYGVFIAAGTLWSMVWAGPAVGPDVMTDDELRLELLDGGVGEKDGASVKTPAE